MFILIDRQGQSVTLRRVDSNGLPVIETASDHGTIGATTVAAGALTETGSGLSIDIQNDWVGEVARLETAHHPRWVWGDTTEWYPQLLARGVRVARCIDLRLSRAIIRASVLTATSALARADPDDWDVASPTASASASAGQHTLFDLERGQRPDARVEFARQREAVSDADGSARLGILLAAESAGALIAAEMRYAGLPWDPAIHDSLLTAQLGSRPLGAELPEHLESALTELRVALGVPDLNPDSPPDLLAAFSGAGITVTSTRSWELKKIQHPAIDPLLRYKKMARLLSANGWNWLDSNVISGRFHPEYVPGGVVTGRWASTGGGGALQLPKNIRSAVVADPGWKLVVADAAQLEPRILAALSADRGMIDAGSAGDLYAGIVSGGAVDTREHAKVAMLGAMYGATTGESGRLLPRLAQAYPRAIALVEDAARAGERGEPVTTRLGRSSPRGLATGYDETADVDQQVASRTRARARGRFTRNFVVQGTAAEWALCWMAGLRPKLRALGADAGLTREPHLVFFLHDEVVVHTPAGLADAVVEVIEQSAADAGRLMFGQLPVAFPLTVAIVQDYGQAK